MSTLPALLAAPPPQLTLESSLGQLRIRWVDAGSRIVLWGLALLFALFSILIATASGSLLGALGALPFLALAVLLMSASGTLVLVISGDTLQLQHDPDLPLLGPRLAKTIHLSDITSLRVRRERRVHHSEHHVLEVTTPDGTVGLLRAQNSLAQQEALQWVHAVLLVATEDTPGAPGSTEVPAALQALRQPSASP